MLLRDRGYGPLMLHSYAYLPGCEGSPHPLNDVTSEKVEEVKDQRPHLKDFPPLRQIWGKTYWQMVKGVGRLGIKPSRVLIYEPDPSMYQPLGHSLYLSEKGREGVIKRRERQEDDRGCAGRKKADILWRECWDTSSCPARKPVRENRTLLRTMD